jgi:uncharacterized LabA/DUF88 family protein
VHASYRPGQEHMTLTDTRSRIAVFIDFDNVEIGVKSTLGGQFDIGLVLEAIKERGEIVTKIAYSDWKRAGDYSRLLTQHAIRMVQRNLTPGGDKNGADITMALDALEMAFTHDHINAFVIVGGDSDFISLVEKLKQYGRRVIVVGGRQFTSLTMQRNCHEFIAYENLVGASRPPRAERGTKQPSGAAHQSDIGKVLPLVKRALQVLSEREVTPQLGLLKSTLLQLDSTFSEREYGAGSFRDFMEKVAQAGAVSLKHAGRSLLVEPADDAAGGEGMAADAPQGASLQRQGTDRQSGDRQGADRQSTDRQSAAGHGRDGASAPSPSPSSLSDADEDEMPVSELGNAEGIRAVQQAFSSGVPRWPMYIRQAKQFLKGAIENFDERRYGFASVVDLLRAAAKTGVVRIERDRQGGMRVFPGTNLKAASAGTVPTPADVIEETDIPEDTQVELAAGAVTDIAAEPPIVDAVVEPSGSEETADVVEVAPSGGRKRSSRGARGTKTAKRTGTEPKAASAKPRARKSPRAKPSEAADGKG